MTVSRRATGSFVVQAGLLAAPVQLFTSIGENESRTKRKELHKACNTPLNRKQFCSCCNKIVDAAEVTKGYEYEKGQYVILTDDECKALVTPSKNVFAVESFVPMIDPVYFDKTYDLEPGKGGEPVFNLLLAGLTDANVCALGRVTLREKEQLAVLRASGGVLFMHTLFYGNEVRPQLGQPLPSVDAKMLAQMKQFIQMMFGEFDPCARTDAYTEAFLAAVDKKRKDPNALVALPQSTVAAPAMDLAEAFKQMLATVPAATPKKVSKKR